MPLRDGRWEVDAFADWLTVVRDDVDGYLEDAGQQALDYDDTPEGGLTEAQASALWTLDQGGLAVVNGLSPFTAAPAQLDIIGEAERLPRLPATRAVYTVTANLTSGATTATVEAGVTLFEGGGPSDSWRWTPVEDATLEDGDPLVVQATEVGRRVLVDPATLRVVTPVDGLDDVSRTGSDARQVGRDAESSASYRVRLSRASGSGGGTEPALYQAMLAVDFVTAASVGYTSPALAVVRIAPGSLTTAQRTELAQAIYDAAPSGHDYDTTASGTQVTGTATGADGRDVTITWYEGDEVTVDGAAVVVLDDGYTLGDGGPLDVEPGLVDAFEASFAGLEPGQTYGFSDYYCALAEVEGIARVSPLAADTTLDDGGGASQSDVVPSSAADLLIPGTLTVTE